MPHILVFGGRGAIGSAIRRRYASLGWDVTASSRRDVPPAEADGSRWIVCDPAAGMASPAQLDIGAPYAAVCWAQGVNTSDSVFDVDSTRHLELYRANCVFVLDTLRVLLDRNLLSPMARLVVISSVWQKLARPDKLSYIMSKAAIGGLVQSASIDLAKRGTLINAVLPSALDTPMTRANLTGAQIERLADATGFGRLCTVDDVVATVEFLCSDRNTGITGQSVPVDLGFSMPDLFDIRSATGSYPVVSERNAFAANGKAMREGVVIADAYFAGQLSTQGIDAISLRADESTKSLDALGGVIVNMRDAGATRDTHLWAVGGGAIQDVAAFIASIYMRGIAWTYIPTTLLGMVDSCIGGKSSINVGSYKNIVGTFHTASRVVVDSSLTVTLSTEQRVAGLAEAAKICYCRGEHVFMKYLSLGPSCDSNADGFERIAFLSLEAKKWFVEIDEFDRAERLLLNLGHTFGHALEGASGYRLSHGVAVGVGILCAMSLSRKLLGRAPGGPAPQLEVYIRGLLAQLPALRKVLAGIEVAGTFDRLKADKKHEIGNYRFVTFAADGLVQVTRLPKTEETRMTVVEALRTSLERLSQ